MSIFVCAKAEEADSIAVSTCIEKDMIRVDVSANRVDKWLFYQRQRLKNEWNKFVLSQITAKIQARAKQKTTHVEATLKLKMQSIQVLRSSYQVWCDTFLQLEQLILDFRELLCVCQYFIIALNMEMRS